MAGAAAGDFQEAGGAVAFVPAAPGCGLLCPFAGDWTCGTSEGAAAAAVLVGRPDGSTSTLRRPSALGAAAAVTEKGKTSRPGAVQRVSGSRASAGPPRPLDGSPNPALRVALRRCPPTRATAWRARGRPPLARAPTHPPRGGFLGSDPFVRRRRAPPWNFQWSPDRSGGLNRTPPRPPPLALARGDGRDLPGPGACPRVSPGPRTGLPRRVYFESRAAGRDREGPVRGGWGRRARRLGRRARLGPAVGLGCFVFPPSPESKSGDRGELSLRECAALGGIGQARGPRGSAVRGRRLRGFFFQVPIRKRVPVRSRTPGRATGRASTALSRVSAAASSQASGGRPDGPPRPPPPPVGGFDGILWGGLWPRLRPRRPAWPLDGTPVTGDRRCLARGGRFVPRDECGHGVLG